MPEQSIIEQALAAVPVEWKSHGESLWGVQPVPGTSQFGLFHGDRFLTSLSPWEVESHMEKCWWEKLMERCGLICTFADKERTKLDVGGVDESFYAPTLIEALAQAIVSVFGKDGGS